jgi:predicted Zn-dependent protease
VPGNLGKAIKFARSPQGRKVLMEAIRVARSEEGKKLIAQARKVATTPEGKRLLAQAKEQAKQFAKAPGATAEEIDRAQAWQKVRDRFNGGKRP